MDIVDALVVTLDIDDTNYKKKKVEAEKETKSLKDTTTKAANEIADSGKKAGEFFRGLKVEILGVLAAFGVTTGLKDFIKGNIDGQAELGRLSKNLDMSASRLAAWGLLAKEMGGKSSDSLTALQAVAGGLAEASIKGHSALTDMARANGISLTDSRGRLLSYEDTLLAISARLRQLPRQQAMYLANNMGVGGIFNQLMLGPEELRRRLAAAEKLTGVTDESARKAQELQQKWVDFGAHLTKIGENIFAKIEPALERLANTGTKWIESIDWDSVITKAGQFATQVDRVVKSFGGWTVVAEALAVALGLKLLSPLAGVVGLVGRLAGLGGSTSVVSGLAGAFRALGLAAASINLAAVAGVVGAAAAVYSPALGGKRRADGTYEDEAQRPTGYTGPSNADLWAKVRGQASNYAGSTQQAALLLAHRSYSEEMGSDVYAAQAKDILAGRVTSDTIAMGAKIPKAAPPAANADEPKSYAELEAKYNLPRGFLYEQEGKESSHGRDMLSPKGAKGWFGFMDATAAQYGVTDPNNREQAAEGAAHYMSDLRAHYNGDLFKALAAYNWGPGNVDKKGVGNLPDETADYVRTLYGKFGNSAPAGGTTESNTHTVSIGNLTVQTQASNPREVAQEIGGLGGKNSLIGPYITGQE